MIARASRHHRANTRIVETASLRSSQVKSHSLRRTFASLLLEAGASPADVMGQMRHTSSDLALEVCSKMMSRERDTGARLDALVRGAEWVPTGTSDAKAMIRTEGVEQVEELHPAF